MLPKRPSVDNLLSASETVHHETLQTAVDDPCNRANAFSWKWATTAEACLVAYERTGDERLVDWVSATYEDVLAWRDRELGLIDEYRGRITSSWGSGRYLPGKWLTHVTMGGRITYPSLRFAQIVLSDRAQFARHVDAAKRYIDIASEVAHEYDEDYVLFDESGEHYYQMPLKDEVDTINHVHALVNCHIALWQLTGDTDCRDKATQCCRVFGQAITVQPDGAYSWPLRPLWTKQKNNRKSEPLWKATVTTYTAMLAWKAGLHFSRGDMEAIARTINDVVMPGETEIRDRVGAKHGITDYHQMNPRYRIRLCNLVGFFPWSEISPDIHDRIMTRVAYNDNVFPDGIFNRAPAIRGYPYFLGGDSGCGMTPIFRSS